MQITLREMCEKMKVSRRVIQGYEKAGLMKATGKNKYGYLLYDDEMVRRAEHIKFLQDLGFKLKDIKNIIDAPKSVMKEALIKRVKELEEEAAKLNRIIEEGVAYMATLDVEKEDSDL